MVEYSQVMPIYQGYAYTHEGDSISPYDDASEYNDRGVSIPAQPSNYKAINAASTQYPLDPILIATINYIESGGMFWR
jgi:hypothetical protein